MIVTRHNGRHPYFALLLPILAAVLSACGGLGGEPPIVATFPPQPTDVADVGYPLQPPDLVRGAQVYAENCTRCHGAGGAGDGELVASGQVPPMVSFTDPAAARGQTPQQWFNTITTGRIDKLMPPWKPALSEEDRWAVAFYTYTLNYTAEQIALGEQIWTGECADCHGETGRGDGPKAAEINRPIGNLTEQTDIITLSDNVLYNIISEGVGENMPAFADTLTDAERQAVVAYGRTLTVANANVIGQAIQPATTPEPETTAEANADALQGTVSGIVTNGTAGSIVPAQLPVNLVVSNAGSLITQQQINVNADGSYTFGDVPIVAGADYVVAAIYRDRLFTSPVVIGDTTVTTMDLPLTIYELTEDPAVISTSGVVAQVSAVGDTLEVREVIRFKNNSDRVFTSSNDLGNNRFASLVIALPPGAQIISFDDPNRYVVSEQDFSFIDTAPVYPGEDHLAIVVYILPYDGNAALIEQPLNYALDGQVRLLMYPETLTVKSDQLASIGPQILGDKTYNGFGATLQLAAGDVIGYEVSGSAAPGATDVSAISAATGSSILPILLLIIGGAAVLAGLLLFFRNRRPPTALADNQRLIDALVQQIAEIDVAHSAGQLNHDLWQRQRAQLKTRLAELLGEKSNE
jgi:mono/diheme cytochrome c family protein